MVSDTTCPRCYRDVCKFTCWIEIVIEIVINLTEKLTVVFLTPWVFLSPVLACAGVLCQQTALSLICHPKISLHSQLISAPWSW